MPHECYDQEEYDALSDECDNLEKEKDRLDNIVDNILNLLKQLLLGEYQGHFQKEDEKLSFEEFGRILEREMNR